MSLADLISTLTPEELANFPLFPHPELGYTYKPNFDNPDTTGPQAIILCSVFIGLATLAVCLRVLCRVKVVKRTGLDDWTAVAALLASATMAGLFIWLLDNKAMGPHGWDVRLVTFIRPQVSQLLHAIQMTGNTANFFAKASILLFVQRLFPRHVSPKTAFAIWFGIIANIIAYITLTVYLGVVCTPRNGAFPATCPGPLQNHVGVAASVVNAFLDIYTLGVSVPTLWMLQMPLRRRVSVVGVLSLGLVTCGLSVATLVKRAMNDAAVDTDPTRSQVILITLGVLEPLIATITACLPAMPALWAEISSKSGASLKRLLSRVKTTSTMSSSKNASQYTGMDDGHSMKSLNSHGVSTFDDVERGDNIKVKTTLTTSSMRRDGTSF